MESGFGALELEERLGFGRDMRGSWCQADGKGPGGHMVAGAH